MGDPPTRRPRRAITGRAIVLGTLIVLLLVLLASPLNRYFASRAALNDASHQLQHNTQQLRELKAKIAKWSDPGYIERQARTRLQYAMPGDTTYVVVDHGQENDIDKTADIPSTTPAGTWNARLWDSVTKADR
ncbi:MAG TPA: septum formation initiator family protein [Jatrophihabitantaceae bacterium]|jgi:cell division protein FtsB